MYPVRAGGRGGMRGHVCLACLVCGGWEECFVIHSIVVIGKTPLEVILAGHWEKVWFVARFF